jgi:hypothetical protein
MGGGTSVPAVLFFGDYEEMTHTLSQLGAPLVSKLEVAEQAQVRAQLWPIRRIVNPRAGVAGPR